MSVFINSSSVDRYQKTLHLIKWCMGIWVLWQAIFILIHLTNNYFYITIF